MLGSTPHPHFRALTLTPGGKPFRRALLPAAHLHARQHKRSMGSVARMRALLLFPLLVGFRWIFLQHEHLPPTAWPPSMPPPLGAAAAARRAAACWAAGAWVRDPARASVHTDALIPYRRGGVWEEGEREAWFWEVPAPAPGCPPYLPFNRADFCAALRGRSIFVAGDSMNAAFHQYLLMKASNGSAAAASGMRDRGSAPEWEPVVCEEGPRRAAAVPRLLTYRLMGPGKESPGDYLRLESWLGGGALAVRGLDPPDFLVLNRGMHFSLTRELLADVNATLAWAVAEFPRATIIWRNTVHPWGTPTA